MKLVIPFGKRRQFRISSEIVILAVILFLGGILRFLLLDSWSLWTDEFHSLHVAQEASLTSKGIPSALDLHPPLYFLLLEGLIRLGQSETLLRLPSAIAGFLAIPVMWLVGVSLDKPKLGLVAAALLAVAPIHVWYSREARMYGLASFFWVSSIYFYIQVIRRDNWLYALGLAGATLGGLYTAYSTLALWIIQIAFFFIFWYLEGHILRRLLNWLFAQIVVLVGFAFWWPYLSQQLGRDYHLNWIELIEQIMGGRGDQVVNFLARFGLTTTLEGTMRMAMGLGIVFTLVIILLSVIFMHRPDILDYLKRFALPAAVLISIAFIVMTVLGAIPIGLSARRQLLVFWLPTVLLAAWAIIRLQNRRIIMAIVGLSLVLTLVSNFGTAYEDWRGAVHSVAEHERQGDLLLISPGWNANAFDYYYDGTNSYTGISSRGFKDQNLINENHVWFIVNGHPALAEYTDPVLAWFDNNGSLISEQSFPRYIFVREYQRD
jgi:uncharacterized membrane protein